MPQTNKQKKATEKNWLTLRLRGAESAIAKAIRVCNHDDLGSFEMALEHLRDGMHNVGMRTIEDELTRTLEEW